MRVVLQRVARAVVTVGGEEVGRIGSGLLALVGVEKGDGSVTAVAAARKIAELRVFADAEGRMNLALADAGGAVLVVSQFTLAASLARGRRPSFDGAAAPDLAADLVDEIVAFLRDQGLPVATGRFGAHMEVELVNDGPVTFVLDLDATGRVRA